MAFNSLYFLIFLLIVVLLYYIIPHKYRAMFLLAASYYFYICASPWLIFLMGSITLVTYGASHFIFKSKKDKTRKLLLVITLIICLGTLIFFKYFNFLLENINLILKIFTIDFGFQRLNIILPVGISFYTFQTLSYVIDVYENKYTPEKSIIYYAVYVSFFPQLVAGPIERPDELIPQLKEEHHFNKEDFLCGLKILVCGFFYKVCIADILGGYVNKLFDSLETATSLSVILAGVFFLIQMYCDFNGYSEIAVGCARMMGIKLTKNFDKPFRSKNFTSFWSRWHITLSRWFNDYVYMPLSFKSMGSKNRLMSHIKNTIIVFLLCGLWHGARWTYILWGLYGGIIVSIESLLKKPLSNFYKKKKINTKSIGFSIFQSMKLFIILIPAGIIFRSENLSQMALAFQRIFVGFGNEFFTKTISIFGFSLISIMQVILLIVSLHYLDNYAESCRVIKPQNEKEWISDTILLSTKVVLIAIVWLSLLYTTGTSDFVYFQF